MLKGNKYGIHRVIEPQGVLTQAAKKIDNDMTKRYSNEIICDVISLNIDSASFTQIEEACNKDVEKIGQMILDIVNERGKMQNPVTGSGGMFIGTVSYIGEELDTDIKVGDKIASLVSLSMTPLKIEKIKAIQEMNQEPISLETPVGSEEDSELGDFVEDQKTTSPYEATNRAILREELDGVLKTLSPREEKVLRYRYGLDDSSPKTLEEVGKIFNVTRERIRQIEVKALRKLRHPSRKKKLEDFKVD